MAVIQRGDIRWFRFEHPDKRRPVRLRRHSRILRKGRPRQHSSSPSSRRRKAEEISMPGVAPVALAASLALLSSPAGIEWANFLRDPTQRNYERVFRMVDACRSPECEAEARPDSQQVRALVSRVSHDDVRAVQLAFQCRRMLDGGDLEDVTRSLGSLADTRPRRFLREAKRSAQTDRQLRAIVRMLPQRVVDDDAARHSAAAARIQSLLTVKDRDLRDLRDVAVAFLRE